MTMLETVLRRDRMVILAALATVTLLASGYLLHLWFAMQHAMTGQIDMSAMPGCTMGSATWSMVDATLALTMWVVMMTGMMLPSAAPMVLIYTRVGRTAAENGKVFASTGWFVLGYIAAWSGFSLVATVAQWGTLQLALTTPMMESASRPFSATVLVAAGLYQLSPLKQTCLASCQSPFAFIQRHGGFRPEPTAAITLGLRHGLYCIGCCWALMTVLFAAGLMNILGIAAITVYVLVEKAFAPGRAISMAAGSALIAAGFFVLFKG